MVFSLSTSLTDNVHFLKKMFIYAFKLHIISGSCCVFIGKGEDQHKASHMFIEVKVKYAQSCPPLCNPMECSLPGSSVHGILQARILEWVEVPFARRSSQPRIKPASPSLQVDSLLSEPPKKPNVH